MKLGALLESGTKELGVRFNLVGILPSVFLFLFILALYWSGAPKDTPKLRPVLDKIEALGVKEGVLFVLGILIFSFLLQPLQLSLVRLLEGYWTMPLVPAVGKILSAPGTAWHRFRRKKLEALTQTKTRPDALSAEEKARIAAADWRLRRYYPAAKDLLPTALGNALRAGEDIPEKKYKLNGVVAWPRLYVLLPERMMAILADRRNQLDVAVRFCVVFLLSTVISIFFLYKHVVWLLVPAATLLLAWLFYRGAVSAAVAYGESVETAFDLYRLDLLKALHLPLPTDLQAERTTNEQVSEFLHQAIDEGFQSIPYEHPKSAEEKKKS